MYTYTHGSADQTHDVPCEMRLIGENVFTITEDDFANEAHKYPGASSGWGSQAPGSINMGRWFMTIHHKVPEVEQIYKLDADMIAFRVDDADECFGQCSWSVYSCCLRNAPYPLTHQIISVC